jgi:starvation-inducible DNA-binding protein
MAAETKQMVSVHDLTSIAQEPSSGKPSGRPLVRHLHRQVANAFVLYANYKHYYWLTYGPLFRDLHLLFDEFAKEVLASIDHLTEHLHMTSHGLPAHPFEAIDFAGVPAARPHSTMRAIVEEADRNVLVVVRELREAARMADELDDRGTADLASQFVQIHERHK